MYNQREIRRQLKWKKQRNYDMEYKIQAVKLAKEIGGAKAALADKDRPWKYQDLADDMQAIAAEDECSDTYGRIRMYQALLLKQPEGVRIPGERTVCRIMEKTGPSRRPERRPDGTAKAGRGAHKSDGLLKRDFTCAEPLKNALQT